MIRRINDSIVTFNYTKLRHKPTNKTLFSQKWPLIEKVTQNVKIVPKMAQFQIVHFRILMLQNFHGSSQISHLTVKTLLRKLLHADWSGFGRVFEKLSLLVHILYVDCDL